MIEKDVLEKIEKQLNKETVQSLFEAFLIFNKESIEHKREVKSWYFSNGSEFGLIVKYLVYQDKQIFTSFVRLNPDKIENELLKIRIRKIQNE